MKDAEETDADAQLKQAKALLKELVRGYRHKKGCQCAYCRAQRFLDETL